MSISASPTPHNFTAGRFLPACRCFVGLGSAACRGWFLRGIGPHTTTDAEKKEEHPLSGKTPPLERKADFRPKYIPCSQSAHYVKHFPQRSLPRCGHHALVCIPMLSAKIRNLPSKYKLKIRFCAATAPVVRAFPSGSIHRVARTRVPHHAGLYQPSVFGRCFQSAHR